MGKDADHMLIVSFPDQSASFTLGFEAGMIWQRMQSGEQVIKSDTGLSVENVEVMQRMADAAGYEMDCVDGHDENHEWTDLVFTRRRKVRGHLSLAIDNS